MQKGQILIGCCDYWEDCYASDAAFVRARGLEVRRKPRSKTLYQGHVTHIPHFYYVKDVVGEYAVLADCEINYDYHGATTAYYDTPCDVSPALNADGTPVVSPATYKRKIRTADGGEYVQIETYIEARAWNGKPEPSYNLH